MGRVLLLSLLACSVLLLIPGALAQSYTKAFGQGACVLPAPPGAVHPYRMAGLCSVEAELNGDWTGICEVKFWDPVGRTWVWRHRLLIVSGYFSTPDELVLQGPYWGDQMYEYLVLLNRITHEITVKYGPWYDPYLEEWFYYYTWRFRGAVVFK